MTDWKRRVITGCTAAPLLFLILNYEFLAIIVVHIALYLSNAEYQKMVLNVLKMHSGESEHYYIDQMNRSKIAIAPTFLFTMVAALTGNQDYMMMCFLLAIVLQFLLRMKDFIGYYNFLIRKKEALSQDPTLDRKIIILTFLQIGGDIMGMVLFHLPLTFGILLYKQVNGLRYTFFWIGSSFQADNGALWVGSLIGKTPFMHSISPKKTWEGVSGAVFVCVLTGLILTQLQWLYFVPQLATKHMLILSLLSGITSVTGDLIESFIKRAANMKDSGTLFPGHGGLLDRLDSIVICGPIFYFYIKLVTGFGIADLSA